MWNADYEHIMPAKLQNLVANRHILVAARRVARATTKTLAKAK
jgi:hypothetical protein